MGRYWFALGLILFSGVAYGENSPWERRFAWLERHGAPALQGVAPGEKDRAQDLVDQLRYRSLEEIQEAGLNAARLEPAPWSGFYWPFSLGGLAHRYNDPNYPKLMSNWVKNEAYLQAELGKGDAALLSPAEKYDLLVGDKEFTLTRQMMQESRRYYEQDGWVLPWLGHCHGWAPATFMEARPEHAVTVPSYDGKLQLTFYPADIKALAAVWWANGEYRVRFIGGRCREQSPWMDGKGRAKRSECLDTNPGTWHLAVVNQLGHGKRSFVLDKASNEEVWNQPIVAYSYELVHPITGVAPENWREAVVPFPEDDRLREVRAEGAVAYTRVRMQLTYAKEKEPEARELETAEHDATDELALDYELELDAAGRIVGGEWRSSTHPDFLWVPAPGTLPRTAGDDALDALKNANVWAPGKPIPFNWRYQVLKSSVKKQPLGRIVQRLVEWSSAGN